jgi:hypothetical protein
MCGRCEVLGGKLKYGKCEVLGGSSCVPGVNFLEGRSCVAGVKFWEGSSMSVVLLVTLSLPFTSDSDKLVTTAVEDHGVRCVGIALYRQLSTLFCGV